MNSITIKPVVMKEFTASIAFTLFSLVLVTAQNPCFPDGIVFTSQEEIDNFQVNYPGCTEIEGNVYIGYWSGTDITNLDGLNVLTSIGDGLSLNFNYGLSSMTGLSNLTSIGGALSIMNEDALESLQGLENIAPASIENIIIAGNNILSACHVQSICDYLSTGTGNVSISQNATGCNSIDEVQQSCEAVGMEEQYQISLTLHPNPTDNGFITITLDNPQNLHLTCINAFGQQVYQQVINSVETVINVSTWIPGIYLAVMLEEGNVVGRGKFVVR